MQLIFKVGDHAKVAAATLERPEKRSVFVAAGADEMAISGHHIHRKEIVAT